MGLCPCCFERGLELIKTKYVQNACCVKCELVIRKMLYVATNGKEKCLTDEEIKSLPKN